MTNQQSGRFSITSLLGTASEEELRCWSGGVLHNWDEASLKVMAEEALPHQTELLNTAKALASSPALVDTKYMVTAAITKLKCVNGQACLCNVVTTCYLYTVKELVEAGLMVVTHSYSDSKTWEEHYECTCVASQINYRVTMNPGWHVPLYNWIKLTTDKEIL